MRRPTLAPPSIDTTACRRRREGLSGEIMMPVTAKKVQGYALRKRCGIFFARTEQPLRRTRPAFKNPHPRPFRGIKHAPIRAPGLDLFARARLLPRAMSARLRSALVFIGFLAVVFLAAALGAHATASGVKDWYPTLAKPVWTPPSWVFGPAWGFLYSCMAVVAWRVWRLPAATPGRGEVLRLWWAQLALNAFWSWAFFWFRNPAAALLVIGALLVTIVWIQPRLAGADRPSALLWTPYVLWVAFAACLNLAIWHLN
jgi:benzodiazapine receptor